MVGEGQYVVKYVALAVFVVPKASVLGLAVARLVTTPDLPAPAEEELEELEIACGV